MGGVRCGGAQRWQRGQVHEDIKRGDEEDGEQDGAGDGALGAADFAGEEADVVVAPVAVGGEKRGLGEAAKAQSAAESAGAWACASRRWLRRGRIRRR